MVTYLVLKDALLLRCRTERQGVGNFYETFTSK
jgi:hypothetical protein